MSAIPRRHLLHWLTTLGAALGLRSAGAARQSPVSAAGRSGPAPEPATADAWDAFCDELRRAGSVIRRQEAPSDAFNRAEGYRYLTRLLRAGLEQSIECSDPDFPVFYQLSNETIKIGGDNPDNYYLNARIDSRRSYRISGRRGTVSYLSLSAKSGGFDADGELRHSGTIDSESLQVDPDGRFEVIASTARQPGNWLPMTPESSMLLVRQTFQDRRAETPAELSIECLDGPRRPAPLDPDAFERQLLSAARFVGGTATIFADWVQSFRPRVNDFTRMDPAIHLRTGGDPTIFYAHGYWRLAPDEALVVEIPRAECLFWNFQVDNYWMESLDYRHFHIHVNKHDAVYAADGGAVLVIAHRDPGVPNWLETAGHDLGTMLYRVVRGRDPVFPRTRVLKVSAVKSALA